MKWFILTVALVLAVTPVSAQELYILGGATKDLDSHNRSYAWQLEYMEGFGEHFVGSISYLNEGHVPLHHRDGNTVQIWARANVLDRRLSLAAGAGPYYYYDTTSSSDGVSTNNHGLGGMFSLAATWYTESRLLLQLRANWVKTPGSIDTVTTVAGIGYQLAPPSTPGPLPKAPPQEKKTTNNEITMFVGRTIVNNNGSEHSAAASIEYRRGLLRHMDWTAAWLYEGDNRLNRRNGLSTQLWAVSAFMDDRFALGVGGGAYIAIDRYHNLLPDNDGHRPVSGIVTLTGSYRFHPQWDVRTSWNRIVTNYNKDTDVILGGVGYRF